MLVDKLALLLLLLELHLHGDLSLEAWRDLHVSSFLLLNELEEWPQSVLVLEQVLDSILVLSDERRLHEAILGVLDQLSEVNH